MAVCVLGGEVDAAVRAVKGARHIEERAQGAAVQHQAG